MPSLKNHSREILNEVKRRIYAFWWIQKHADFLLILNWHQISPFFNPSHHFKGNWTELGLFEESLNYLI
jgi:hypothetical protein